MKAIKVTLKHMLSKAMSGEKPTLSYSELCMVLAMAANVVNDRPVALRSHTNDNFEALTVNQLLGRTSGATLEPQAVEDGQYFGASRYQQDLLNLWWKLWKEQGFASLPPYSHLKEANRHANLKVGDNKVCGTYRLCQMLSTKCGLVRKAKVGYKERLAGKKYKSKPLTEIEIDVQRLVLLVPTNEVERLREPDEKESVKEEIDKIEDEAPDKLLKDLASGDATGRDLRELAKEAGLEETYKTEGEAPDELLKDVTADDGTGHNLRELAKVAGLDRGTRLSGTFLRRR